MIRMSILVCLLSVLFVGPVIALPTYYMDPDTAADMRLLDISTNDVGDLEYVGYQPGGSGDWVFGVASEYGAGEGYMAYEVGFTGGLYDNDQSTLAEITIGLTNPGFSGAYDKFELPIANDDDDIWKYRAYVMTDSETIWSDWTDGLNPGEKTSLTVSTPGLDYTDVTGIGFQIQWDRSLNNDRLGDNYNTSVVPVPGALLLGLIGLGSLRLKFRK